MEIDISKGLDMTEEEKNIFVEMMDMERDFFPMSTIVTNDEIALYHAIIAERQ